jgi:hypothetical protein
MQRLGTLLGIAPKQQEVALTSLSALFHYPKYGCDANSFAGHASIIRLGLS